MKSYLSLIPISAKVHKRHNRMTMLCIIIAVFLVTAVFSMADMGVRTETARLTEKHGSQAITNLLENPSMQNYYLLAGVLFVMILAAGVLMISSSINSNVAQRTQFFGMMRCIGMSKRQIIHFVRLEALNWCKKAIPIGVLLGIVATWGLCAVLHFLVGEEFAQIPLFGVSLIGIVSGIIMGIITVLIAAGAPARKASKVSPVTAVSDNLNSEGSGKRGIKHSLFKIETTLGINHAVAGKKNVILMTSSFALSMILFLIFSVGMKWVDCVMPQFSSAYEIGISSNDGENTIDSSLPDQLADMDGVKQVFARRNLLDASDGIDLISYDDFDLNCLEKDNLLEKGSELSKVYGDSNYVLIVGKDNDVKKDDTITVKGTDLYVAGRLKFNPFSQDGSSDDKLTLITSSETFEKLTGISDYSLIMIQTTKDVTDENVQAMKRVTGENCNFLDERDLSASNTYLAFKLFVYAFLIIIMLVTILNVMNSISMSVSAKIKQYGAMRAIGMEERQMIKMIAAEAFTYTGLGYVTGSIVGILIQKKLYEILITSHYSYVRWEVPIDALVLFLLLALVVTLLAVYTPSKRIHQMSITDTINEL